MDIPEKYKTAGTLMLVAGLLNILFAIAAGFGLFFLITSFVITSLGILLPCYACCIWPVVPMAFGIFELITGLSIMQGKPVRHGPMVALIGMIISGLNLATGTGMIPLILEIASFVMLNDAESKDWIASQSADLLT